MKLQNNSKASFWLFMLGLGSATKIFFLGTISFSELVIFPIAPIMLLLNWQKMRQEGFVTFLYMLVFLIAGLGASSLWNHTRFPYVLKLFAVFYGFGAYYIVFYRLLRNNFGGLWWFAMGAAISGIITIWAFNPTADVSSTGFAYIGEKESEEVMSGPLFWIGKVRSWGSLPIIGAYLKIPLAYSVLTPIIFTFFAMFTTITGRAQSICVLLGGAMMFVGRKSRVSMGRIGRHFFVFLIIGFVVLVSYKITYSYLAGNGILGEEARHKYEWQTSEGKGALNILMSGRKEFFIAATAIIDSPIFGFGPRAEDRNDYAGKFLRKYGSYEDVQAYSYRFYKNMQLGMIPQIPTHSHIMAAWVWCGLPGLLFFLWVLYCLYRHLRFYSAAIPQWFGYYALTIPSMLWSIFFNPFGSRATLPLLMACLFFARAVHEGRLLLPPEMEMEARKHD